MHDSRIDRLADLLLDHSCTIERGEKVLIEAFDLPDATLVCRLVEKAAERGAVPLVSWKSNAVLRSLYQTATVESMKSAGQIESRPDGNGAGLHRHSRRGEQQPVCRRAAREDGPLPGALVESGPHRHSHREDQMGRAAVSDRFVRSGGQHEHAGVRGFLLRRLHGRLRRDEGSSEAARRTDEQDRPRSGSLPPTPNWSSRSREFRSSNAGASGISRTAKCSRRRSATASTATFDSIRSRAIRAPCSTTSSSNSKTARS